jgi:8-oxo-dGTP pyrophosphatase MutT (NUDIX family)
MKDNAHTCDEALKARIFDNLTRFERRAEPDADGLKHAAVAITVIDDGAGDAAFILTRRQPRLRSHGGQLAMPGGRIDPGENAVSGALRELEEEVGLSLNEADVLGILDDYPTRSGYVITPVVLWAGTGVELTPNPEEVAYIIRFTFAELTRPDSPEFVSIEESERPVIRLLMGDDDALHAPSAAMVYQFREVGLLGRHETRVAHLGEPVWAWR